MIVLIALLFVVILAGFLGALLTTPKAGYRPPVQKAQAWRDPALFVPLEGEEGDFPRGTWVQ